MRCLMLICVLGAIAAPSAHADFDFPARRAMTSTMFAAAVQPIPDPTWKDDDYGAYELPGDLSLSFWLTPYMRFPTDPEGAGAGFGFEFYRALDPQFGLMGAAGLWLYEVDYEEWEEDEGDWDTKSEEARAIELEFGPRVYPVIWLKGGLYFDMRLSLAFIDGGAPIKGTTSLGLDWRVGVELGRHRFRVFLEGGISYRGALNHRDAGWLDVGNDNASGGVFIDLLRVGLRFYL